MYRTFSKLAAAAIVAGFTMGFAHTSFAQEKDDYAKPLTKQGSAAMLFSINGLGSFGIASPGSLMVPAVGVEYFISDDLALRILLGLSSRSDGADSTQSRSAVVAGSTQTFAGKLSETDFAIGAGAMMHFRPLFSTSPYVGAQISFQSMSGTVTQLDAVTKKDFSGKQSVSQFGIDVLAGFDWFFTRGIAIGAEAGLGLTTSSSSTDTTDEAGKTTTTDGPSATVIALATHGDVHLVVYF